MNDRFQNLLEEHKCYFPEDVYKKLNMWSTFFNKVLSPDPFNVNIHSLVFTQKIIIFCGIVESLTNNQNQPSKEKFKKIMQNLNDEEKLIFINQILISEREQKENLDEEAIGFYLENLNKDLNTIFLKKLDYFYGFRSNLVHQGEWPGSAILEGDTKPLFFITKASPKRGEPKELVKILERAFDINFPIDLDELILRAIIRYIKKDNIKEDDIKHILKNILINKSIANRYFQLFQHKFNL